MNSIKSLATLMILAVVAGYLYLKITETEPVLPPEAADLTYDVPQVDMGNSGIAGLTPPAGIPGDTSAFGPASDASAAPPFDPSMADSSAPAWSGAPTSAPTASTGPSGSTTSSLPPPISLPSEVPPVVGDNRPPANPFDGANEAANAVSPFSNRTPGNVSPRSTALPPPGSLGASQETVIEGRVYDEPAEETPAPQPIATPAISPPHLSVAPDLPAHPVAAAAASSPSPKSKPPIEITVQTVESLLSKGQLAEALRVLTEYYHDPSLSPVEQNEVALMLSQLAGTVVYSAEHRLGPPHRVAPGETLSTIAKQYNVPAELLAKINQLPNPNVLTPGTELKVVRGPFVAVVDLTHRELILTLDGHYAGRFPVQVGTDRPPIEGQWVVATKQLDPEYVGDQTLISGGDPSNPLGRRMLALASPSGDKSGVGIHGSPVGVQTDPRGSIRLSSADANDVFDILSVGSKVIVRR